MKLTKQQKEAINLLKADHDELRNKPGRFFYAIKELVIAFTDRDKETLDETLADIDMLKDDYYRRYNYGRIIDDIDHIQREMKRDFYKKVYELEPKMSEKFMDGFEEGSRWILNEIPKRLLEEMIKNYIE